MTIQETIKSKLPAIKKLLFGAEKFEDAKLVDGTIVRVDPAIEVGALVQVIDSEGNLIPIPDGEVQMEDGAVVTVEGGLIMAVLPAPEEAAVVEEGMEGEGTPPPAAKPNGGLSMEDIQTAVMGKINSEIAERINRLKFASEAEVTALRKENADLRKAVGEVADLFEAFVSEPTEQPTKKHKNYFKTDEPKGNLDKWLALKKDKKTTK